MRGGSAGLMTIMALPCAAYPGHSACGGAGEFVNVFACAGACGTAGHRGHNLGVTHGLHAAHGVHHRDGGLAAAGDHIDIHRTAANVLLEVDGRHAIRADGRWREVDHHRAKRVDLARILSMRIGAGGIEDDLYLVGFDVRYQAVHAVGSGFQPVFACLAQTIRVGINTDHPDRFQSGAAQQLGQQVGADVARADQGAMDFFRRHGVYWVRQKKWSTRRCRRSACASCRQRPREPLPPTLQTARSRPHAG